MLISFNILLYNIVKRNIETIVACDKVKSATIYVLYVSIEWKQKVSWLFSSISKKYGKVEIIGVHEAKKIAKEELQWTPLLGNLFSFSTITLKNIQRT